MNKLLAFFGKPADIATLRDIGYVTHVKYGKVPVDRIQIVEIDNAEIDFVKQTLLIGKNAIRNATIDQQVIMLDTAIRKATKNGNHVKVTIWKNGTERAHGTPSGGYQLATLRDTLNNPEHPAAELLVNMHRNYGADGCAEIIIYDDENEYTIYHEEYNDTYISSEIFEFI